MDGASEDRSARLEHRILLRDNHAPYHRRGNPDPCPLRLLILRRAINRHHAFGFAAPGACRTVAISALQIVIRLESHGVSSAIFDSIARAESRSPKFFW